MDFSSIGGISEEERNKKIDFSSVGGMADTEENVPPSPISEPNRGILDKAKNLYNTMEPYSPTTMLTKTAPEAVAGAFNKAGEMTTEFLGRKQVNPNVSAGVGTAISMAPDIAMSFIGTEAKPQTASKLFANAPSPVKAVSKRMFSGIMGPSVEAMEARYANPEAIKNAVPYQDLGADMAKTLTTLKDKAIKETDNAWDSLMKLKAEPRSKIIKMINDVKSEFRITGGGPLSSQDKRAFDEFSSLVDRVKGIRQKGVDPKLEQFLDQRQMKEVIQSLDHGAEWDNANPNQIQMAYRKLRMKVDDYLKTENPQYKEIMEPISQKFNLINDISGSFGMKKEGGKFLASDTTAGKFPLFLDEKRGMTRGNLEKLKSETGKDFLKSAQTTKYASQFEPGATRPAGSRRVNLGAAIGGGAGALAGGGWGSSATGALVGSMVGSYLDTQGGAAAGKIIDFISKTRPDIVAQFDQPSLIALVSKYIKEHLKNKKKKVIQNGHVYDTGEYE